MALTIQPYRVSALLLAMIIAPGLAKAGGSLVCAEGFTKVLDQGGSAICRRTENVRSSDVAEALSLTWWAEARCSGSATDRQAAISQSPRGDWTVSVRFFCNGD